MKLPTWIKISAPEKSQLVHGAERAIAVFVVGVAGFLKLSHDPISKASLTAAALAGVTAVYQFVLSSLTTL